MLRALSTLPALTAVTLVFVPATALACPDCPAAVTVRRAVFGQGFWSQLGLVLLPLALVLGIVFAVYVWLGRRPKRVLKLVRNDPQTRTA